MKKTLFLAGICLAMCLSAFAQNERGNRPNGQRMRMNFDAVVDTAVINHIGLDDAVLQQVYQLQTTKQEEQRAMFQNNRRERGQRMTDEERKAMQEKRQAFTDQYRKDLRALIGDQLYITYLEKMLDRQSMMRFQRGFGGGNQMGGQRQGGQRGGFGGDNGGGFGGGFGGNEF